MRFIFILVAAALLIFSASFVSSEGCTLRKPQYIDSQGALIKNYCAVCGCLSSYICQSDGSCISEQTASGSNSLIKREASSSQKSPKSSIETPTKLPSGSSVSLAIFIFVLLFLVVALVSFIVLLWRELSHKNESAIQGGKL